mmetsp:Transcript_9172/g.17271  ORF Transcript_9172/g.17271 Transcript_9172/m.17271 type:complete len:908 (-) Transcript_9172:1566-4289(-)|eukprot:CAMPEP_0176483498 /NCGR_PEP_ID=MMETSP0200_2-20121128/3951_1 /TAXON_ID=947934 /ORGANISM="Chaetoceros sp., Strain GSL56" /LENGTH=907 /DNA_ID=CAMNT_0017879905 /DNA_START=99 /DNA_END=2822 /DNA_ORIENTATION=-
MSSINKLQPESDDNGISTESLMDLLNKMVMRGYFHPPKSATTQARCDLDYTTHNNNNNNINKNKNKVDDGQAIQHIHSSQNNGIQYSIADSVIVLPALSNNNVVRQARDHQLFVLTKEHLAVEIQKCIEEIGRISVADLSVKFHLSTEDIYSSTRMMIGRMKNKDAMIHIVGNEILNDEYLDVFFQGQLNITSIWEKKLVQDIALECNLPLQFVMSAITKRIQEGLLVGVKFMTLWDGTTQIVTLQYEEKMFQELDDLVQNAQEPMTMASILNEVQLEPNAVSNHIRSQCGNNILNGYLQEDSSSCIVTNPMSAVYVPRSYTVGQEEEVISFFYATGYITFERGEQLGLSKKRLTEVILMNIPQAVILSKCLVFRSKIEPPIKSALEACIALNTFLDLSLYFPDKMSVLDSVTFLKDYVFCDMDNSVLLGCLIFLVDKEPFYFSHGMIKNISTKLLQSLIVDYAKQRAKDIVDGSETVSSEFDGNDTQLSTNKKTGRRPPSWKMRLKRGSMSDKTVSYGIVPLVSIAKAVAQEYPDLAEVQSGYEINLEVGRIPQWNDEKDGSDGPLYSFCRHVFGTSVKFQEDCTKAVEAEISRMRAMKIGASIQSCDTANLVCNEESFESAFKSACYLLQILAKYPKSLINDDMVQHDKAQEVIDMFLNTCAGDFTRRLTEYVLFKNGVEQTLFSFYDEQVTPSESDNFYSEINISTKRNFPRVFLSCSSKKESDPLLMLQHVLPSDKGANLAQMWILCGGKTYFGGEIATEDNGESFYPGNLEKFLQHTQESCLTICGIPFKILDKKIEKQIMTARRKELSSQLDQATTRNDILELSFILLFQKLKGFAICNITEIAIDDLCRNQKIPIVVAGLLQKLTESLKQGNQVDGTTLKSLKELGLCKDLSRYCSISTG